MLCSPVSRVQLPALHCLSALCKKLVIFNLNFRLYLIKGLRNYNEFNFVISIYSNEKVSTTIATKSYGGKAVPDLLVDLMARDKPHEMQLAAAICLTFLHRAGALSTDDPKIIFKSLQCLVIIKEFYQF